MERKIITNIINKKYVEKVDKYVVDIALYGEPKQKVWLTEKQMINLDSCFEKVGGYSNKKALVIGYWNDKGYYAYATIDKQPKTFDGFVPPKEQDVSDLWEV